MYLGPFYFDTKEIFLVLAIVVIILAIFFGLPLLWFDKATLLTLLVLILITKGLLPAIHNEAFFILALVTLLLTIWIPAFQVVLFYFVSFLLFRLFKII